MAADGFGVQVVGAGRFADIQHVRMGAQEWVGVFGSDRFADTQYARIGPAGVLSRD